MYSQAFKRKRDRLLASKVCFHRQSLGSFHSLQSDDVHNRSTSVRITVKRNTTKNNHGQTGKQQKPTPSTRLKRSQDQAQQTLHQIRGPLPPAPSPGVVYPTSVDVTPFLLSPRENRTRRHKSIIRLKSTEKVAGAPIAGLKTIK